MKWFKLYTSILICLCSQIFFGQNKIQFLQLEHDFGFVEEGERANFTFVFENLSSDSLQLTSVSPSCGCTTPNWPRQVFLEGESGEIEVSYNSIGRLGYFYKYIRVLYKGSDEPINLVIKGFVVSKNEMAQVDDSGSSDTIADLVFEKMELNLGTTERAKLQNREVKVKNTGKEAITIISSGSGCGCASVENDLIILPSQTQTIKIKYIPKYVGDSFDKLVIITNEIGHPIYEMNLKANVVESLALPKTILENTNDGAFGF